MSCDRSYYLRKYGTGEIVLFTDDDLEVAGVDNVGLLYKVDPLIIHCTTDALITGVRAIEDPELLKFKNEFQSLCYYMRRDKIEETTHIMKLLEPFNVLIKKKLEYALEKEDFKCGGCSAENCRSVKILGSIINIHADHGGFELWHTTFDKIVEHICALYPPRAKSARNFSLLKITRN